MTWGKLQVLTGAAFACAVAVSSFSTVADAATERKVHGIITGLDGPVVTVSPMNVGGHHTASGRVDPQRTRLVMDGRPARLGELQLTQDARGELGLDDVWMTLQVSTRK